MTVIVTRATRGPGLVGPSTWRDIRGIVHPNSEYQITPLMDTADVQDATLSITLTIEFSDDGVVLWGGKFEVSWRCGGKDRNGVLITTAPSFTWSSSAAPPGFYRVSANLSRVVNNIGLDVTLV